MDYWLYCHYSVKVPSTTMREQITQLRTIFANVIFSMCVLVLTSASIFASETKRGGGGAGLGSLLPGKAGAEETRGTGHADGNQCQNERAGGDR